MPRGRRESERECGAVRRDREKVADEVAASWTRARARSARCSLVSAKREAGLLEPAKQGVVDVVSALNVTEIAGALLETSVSG